MRRYCNHTPKESVKWVTWSRCMALELLKATGIILQSLVKFYDAVSIVYKLDNMEFHQ